MQLAPGAKSRAGSCSSGRPFGPALVSRCPAAPNTSLRHQIVARAAQGSTNDFGAEIARIAKKIQGALPIVGLVSRLASPEGGFNEVAYPEFSRTIINTAPAAYSQAIQQLEAKHGKTANSRWVLLIMWLAKHGAGILTPREVVLAARRLRISADIQIEMERFETARDEALKKYKFMERPLPPLEQQLGTAVDALAVLVADLKDGQPIPEADASPVAEIVATVWPDAGRDAVMAAVQGRTQRSYT